MATIEQASREDLVILSVEFRWIGETSAGINVHKCAELLLVVRIDHVKTV